MVGVTFPSKASGFRLLRRHDPVSKWDSHLSLDGRMTFDGKIDTGLSVTSEDQMRDDEEGLSNGEIQEIEASSAQDRSSNPRGCMHEAYYRDKNSFNSKRATDTKDELLAMVAKMSASDEPGQIVVDVGAHVGEFTALMCTRFPTARIHSFEPGM